MLHWLPVLQRFSHLFAKTGTQFKPDPLLLCAHGHSLADWSHFSSDHESRGLLLSLPHSIGSWTCPHERPFPQTSKLFSLPHPQMRPWSSISEKQNQSEKSFYRFQSIHVPVSPYCPVLRFQPAPTDELSGLLSEPSPAFMPQVPSLLAATKDAVQHFSPLFLSHRSFLFLPDLSFSLETVGSSWS